MAQELNIRLDTDSRTPLYRQIYDYIRDEIRNGSLQAGERLPSTRSLAGNLHVARSTAEFAYGQLLSEGYIRAKKNSGFFVNDIENLVSLHLADRSAAGRGGGSGKDDPKKTEYGAGGFSARAAETTGSGRNAVAGRGDLIDFSPRHTEMSFFPYSTWKRIMREVMANADPEMFSLGESRGDLSLRSTIAHYLHFSRGVRCTPDQVVVGAGNDYLFMLLRHILGEGRTVAMENPTYLRAAQIFRSFGYRITFVDMDEEGMVPASVRRSDATLAYTMPAHQFPMGSVMPVARRAALLRWAGEAEDRYIIEDDYDSEFRFRGKPIPSLQSLDGAGRVIYMGTFSKAIAPAIRVSYMILPPALLALYRQNCHFFSSTVSRIDQRILDEFMKNGHFERYLNKMRNIYKVRHDELIEQLGPFRDRFRIRGAGTGLHVVLEALPDASFPGIKMSGGDPVSGSDRGPGHDSCFGPGHSLVTGPGSDRDPGSCPGSGLGNGPGPDPFSVERELSRLALENGVRVYCLSDFYMPAAYEASHSPDPSGGTEETNNVTLCRTPVSRASAAKACCRVEPASSAGEQTSVPDKNDAKASFIEEPVSPAGVQTSVPDKNGVKASFIEEEGGYAPSLLLGFGALAPEQIREGVRRMADAWK